MKKKYRIMIIGVALCALLTACGGAEFDAQGYLQALLDLSYKDDAAAYIEMGLGTQEDADALYESGINSEMNCFKEKLDLSDEQEDEFLALFKEIYQKARYTAGEAKKQEDGSYLVEISYERMHVFESALTAYYDGIAELPEEWDAREETPTQEEMLADMTEVLRSALRVAIDNAWYDEPETLTITIELAGNVYTPNSGDAAALERALFDSDYSVEAE